LGPVQVAGAAGFGAGAGEALAAKRLHADEGADHVAVDIAVADPKPREDVAHGFVDPVVDAEGEAVAGRGDLVALQSRGCRGISFWSRIPYLPR
jgi:hypothetical protein